MISHACIDTTESHLSSYLLVDSDKGIQYHYTRRLVNGSTVPIYLDECVKAAHIRDALPLSELPAGGFLRKDSFDTNGIVVSRLGEKMRDYGGYQSRLEQLLSENKTDDEICRVLAKKAIHDLTYFRMKNKDGTWEDVEVEVDASFSEIQTKHNDDLPVAIRHSVFGPDSEHGAKDLVKSGGHTGSSLSYRGERKQGASHEKSKKKYEAMKSRGDVRSVIMFNNKYFGLGTHSIEESERIVKKARSLANFTKKLVNRGETEMPNTEQFTRMLEVSKIRTLAKTSSAKMMGKDPEGPANIQFILREYKKAMAERDPCKYHRIVPVFILSAFSTRHSLIVLPSSLFFQQLLSR